MNRDPGAKQRIITVKTTVRSVSRAEQRSLERELSAGNVLLVGVLVVAAAILVGLLIWKLQLGSQNQSEANALQLGQSAAADYAAGDYQSAEAKLAQALKLTQQNPALFAGIIDAIAQQGNQTGQEPQAFNQAQQYISQATSLYPNDPNILTAVGYIYETDGKYTDALNFYNKALEANANDSETWFHKGHDLEFLGQTQNAFTAYNKAYTLDPHDPMAVLAQARENISNGNNTKAFTFFQQASQIPASPPQVKAEAFTNMATITQANVLNMKTALSYASQAAAADPSYAPALAEDGYLLALNGSPNDGVSDMKKAIALNPRISMNYYLMGVALRAGGFDTNAANFLAYALLHIDNDNTLVTAQDKTSMKARLSYEFAKTVSKIGNQPLALQYLTLAIQENPQYKVTARNDEQYNFFKGLASNSAFQKLLQS